ncbi:MAG: DUF1330 domain-containing protein [Bauldia sp.]
MAKGYWIVRVDVRDGETYQKYLAANAPALAKYEGRFLVRGGAYEAKVGTARKRNVVVEFPSYAAALACYQSPEYGEAIRVRGTSAELEHLVVEGYDGPQPGAAEGGRR